MALALVILAGDVGYAQYLLEGRNKALLPLAGRPLINHTLRVIEGTSEFSDVIVVAPSEVLALLPRFLGRIRVQSIEQASSVGGNLRRAFMALPSGSEGVLAMTCDAPLVTSVELDQVGRAFREESADIMVAISRHTAAESPAIRSAYRQSMVPFREGAFLLGNLFGVRSGVLAFTDQIDELFSLRKQTHWLTKLRTIGKVGRHGFTWPVCTAWLRLVAAKAAWNILPESSLPFSLSPTVLTVEAVINIFVKKQLKIRLLQTVAAGACWDVDTKQQLVLVRELVAERQRTQSERRHA